jgi:hypothetical protein
VAVLITVSATAGAAIMVDRAPRPVEARRKRMEVKSPVAGARAFAFRATGCRRQAKACCAGAESDGRRPPFDLRNEALKLSFS